MAKGAAKKEEAAADAKPKGKSKKLLIVIVAALVVVLGGGAATFFFLAKKGGAGHEEAAAHPAKAPVFVNLEAFTVNLQPESGEQYLQMVATLKVADKSVADDIKVYMPELRHRILLLLSGKKPSEIATPDGRELLAEELRREANAILNAASGKPGKAHSATKPIGKVSAVVAPAHAAAPNDPVQGVLFTSFIVQ